MIDESTKITALTNVGTTKKAIKISTVEVVIWTLPKMGGLPPDWKTWASKQQQENEKVSDKKPILFATIIIISLIAVENGIFLEATPPFYDFCAKTCKQLFASLALLGLWKK